MPHDIFASMFDRHRDEFDESFGVERLPEFWRGASRLGVSKALMNHVSCPTCLSFMSRLVAVGPDV